MECGPAVRFSTSGDLYADIISDVKDVRRVRDALEVAFGDSKKFDDFMETLAAESKMQETAQPGR